MTLHLPTLHSADNRRIKAAVALRRHRHRRATGQFVAEGLRQVTRALDAGLALGHGFVCEELLRTHQADRVDTVVRHASAAPGAAPWFSVSERLMRKMAYRQNPSGILAVLDRPGWTLEALEFGVDGASVAVEPSAANTDPHPGLPKFTAPQGGADLWLIAVGMTKPGNLGAMARSAEAAGAWGMFVADGEVDPFNPNAIRASTGAVFRLPLVCAASDRIHAFLRRRRARIVAAVPCANSSYTALNLTGPTALVIGAEDRGLTPPWIENREVEAVAIPTLGHVVDSLNASAAAAVLLFEAVRQRHA